MHTHLLSCSNVIFILSVSIYPSHLLFMIPHTISSLQIGQTMRLLASAAALDPCSSNATLAVMSSLLTDTGVPLVWESSEIELSDGDSRPDVGLTGALLAAGAGGARFLPDPSTRPPPSWRRAAIIHHR